MFALLLFADSVGIVVIIIIIFFNLSSIGLPFTKKKKKKKKEYASIQIYNKDFCFLLHFGEISRPPSHQRQDP